MELLRGYSNFACLKTKHGVGRNYPLTLVTHTASGGKNEKDRCLDPRPSTANTFASHDASAPPPLPIAGGRRGACPVAIDVAHGRWISTLGGRWIGARGLGVALVASDGSTLRLSRMDASASPPLPVAGGRHDPCLVAISMAHGRWIRTLGGRWIGARGLGAAPMAGNRSTSCPCGFQGPPSSSPRG